MSNLTNAIVMYIRCDASEYKKEIKNCQKGTEDWQNAVNKKKTAEQFLAIATAVTVVVKVMKDLYKALSACVESANTFNRSFTKLQGVINNSGFSASAKDMDDFAVALSQASQYTRSEIDDVQTLFIATNQLSEDGVKRATQATIDLATAMGKDLTTASRSLMKALEEPQTAMEGLRRSGIVFTEAEAEAIKNLEKYGRIAEAQEKILAKVESKYQGISKAISDTPTGTLDKIKNTWENIKTNLGNSILDSIKPSLDALLDALTKIKEWSDEAGAKKADNYASSLGMSLAMQPFVAGIDMKELPAYKSLMSMAQRYGSEYVKTRIAELMAMDKLTLEQERQLLGWSAILEPVMQYEESVKSIKDGMDGINGESEKIPTLWEEWKKSWDENEDKIKSVEKELERLRESDHLSDEESNYYTRLTKDLEEYKDKRLQLAGQEKQISEATERDKYLKDLEESLQKQRDYTKWYYKALKEGNANEAHHWAKMYEEENKNYKELLAITENGEPEDTRDEFQKKVDEYLARMAEAETQMQDAINKNEEDRAMYWAKQYADAEQGLKELRSMMEGGSEDPVEKRTLGTLSYVQKLEKEYNDLEEQIQSIRDYMEGLDPNSTLYELLKVQLEKAEAQLDSMTGKLQENVNAVDETKWAWKSLGLTMSEVTSTMGNAMASEMEAWGEALATGEESAHSFARASILAIASILDAIGQKALVKAAETIAEAWTTKDWSLLGASAKWGAVGVLSSAGAGYIRGLQKFQDGGIVRGSSRNGDNVLIRANAGELILNRIQQERVASMMGSNGRSVNITLSGNFMGNKAEVGKWVYEGIRQAQFEGIV